MGRRWFKIGAGSAVGVTTIIGLFLFLISHYGFEITGTDDICAGTLGDPCISYIGIKNPTRDYVDVFNQNQIQLEFSPSVKDYYLFRKDGRCKGGDSCAAPNGISLPGWSFIDFTNETKPLKDKVYVYRFPAYTTKEFLLWGLKHNPTDRVKWALTLDLEGLRNGELDPIWESPNPEYSFELIMDCWNETKYNWIKKSKEVWSEVNQTNELEYYYKKEEYFVEDCEEIGVKVGDNEIKYRQEQVNCIRTDNILCCLDKRDGGTYLQEGRTEILSGESGFCKDLNNNLKQLSYRSDWGNLEIKAVVK